MRQKIILLFVLLAVFPALFLGYLVYLEGLTHIKQALVSERKILTRSVAVKITQDLQSVYEFLHTLASVEGVRNLEPDTSYSVISSFTQRKFREKSPLLSGVVLVDRRGKEICSVGAMGKNWYLERFWADYRLGSHDTDFSEVIFTENNKYIDISVPIRDRSYIVNGMLVCRLRLDYFKDYIRSLKFGESGSVFLLDSFGRNICSSSPQREKNFDTKKVFKNLRQDSDWLIFEQEQSEWFCVCYSTASISNSPVLKFTVIVSQELREAFQTIFSIRKKILEVITGAVLLAVILGIYYATRITVPLNQLVKITQRISGSDLETPVEIQSGDEIGKLAEAFELMRQNLRKKIYEISTLYSIGQDISSELDFNTLLDKILDVMIGVMGAEQGSLMLYDEDTGKLKIGIARGLSDEVIEKTMVGSGEGISGYVMMTAQPLLIRDTRTDSKFLELKQNSCSQEIREGTLLSVPLIYKEKVCGVINVSRSKANSFNEGDLELFRGIATHVSIALENASLYQLAITDGMTKLFINRYFQQRLSEEIRRSRRYDQECAVILLDVDHFKNFNDSYGHQQGDRVLKLVSAIIRDSFRDVDIPCRYGGEEFIVICPEQNSMDVLVPAERLRKRVENEFISIGEERVQVTISIGIASFPIHAKTKEELIEKADIALYRSKEEGRNRISIYSSLFDEIN